MVEHMPFHSTVEGLSLAAVAAAAAGREKMGKSNVNINEEQWNSKIVPIFGCLQWLLSYTNFH